MSAVQLIPNPSAEVGNAAPYDWETLVEADVPGENIWSIDAYTGARSLQVIIRPNSAAIQYHSIGWRQIYDLNSPDAIVQRGRTYRLRARAKSVACQTKIYILTWEEDWLNPIGIGTLPIVSGTWVETEWIEFTVPETARYFALGFRVRLDEILAGEVEGSAWADDFEMYEALTPVECSVDADCPSERPYCVGGTCVECITTENCPEGFICKDGICIKGPPPLEKMLAIAGPSIVGVFLSALEELT